MCRTAINDYFALARIALFTPIMDVIVVEKLLYIIKCPLIQKSLTIGD
jgi:hypothetical protein